MNAESRNARGRRGRRWFLVSLVGVLCLASVAVPGIAGAKNIVVYQGGGALIDTYTRFGNAAGRTLVYSDTIPADLSDTYCVLLPANTQAFTTPQKSQLKSFASSGGTVIAMTENQQYPGGPPATAVMNNLAGYFGVAMSAGSDAIDDDYHSTPIIGSSPYTAGVTSIGYAFTNRIILGPPAVALVATQNSTTFIGAQQVGAGKLVYSGDTNIFSDYLGAPYTLDSNTRFAKNLCGDIFPPVITITTPPSGTPRYAAGQPVTASWSCTDLDGDVDPDPTKTFATTASGLPIDTSAPAGEQVTRSFSVTCTDKAGNTATQSHDYVVDDRPPVVTITVPGTGPYTRGSVVGADWSCTDPDDDIDVKAYVNGALTGVASGQPIDTASKGTKSYKVTCTDFVGNTATQTVQYTVPNSPPVVSIASPLEGRRFTIGASAVADWLCTDPDGAQDLDPDPNKTFGTVADGDALDTTGSVGQTVAKQISVTCTDLEAEVATKTVTYKVDGNPPIVTIAVPANGGSYPRGSNQPANWSCTDPDGDADVKTKVATLPVGTPINTGTLGSKSFTVTCTDQAGNVSTKTVTFTVIGGPPDITIAVPGVGATFEQGQVVSPSYSCNDVDGDLKSCVREGGAAGPIDTSKVGTFKFTVNAADAAGNTATKTVTYTVKAKSKVAGAGVSPSGAKAPASKACSSRRQFRIRVKKLKGGVTAKSATVFVNGKKTLTRRGKRVTAIVTLKGLKKGTYTVKINVKYSDGRTLRYTRKFRTCVPKGK